MVVSQVSLTSLTFRQLITSSTTFFNVTLVLNTDGWGTEQMDPFGRQPEVRGLLRMPALRVGG